MTVLDTSAFFALIAGEADARSFRDAILAADSLAMSAVSVFECRTVLYRRFGSAAVVVLDDWLSELPVTIVPFDDAQAEAAFDAYRRYGKGQGHPAQLNICDCAAYALAVTRNEALLFKGNDFARTDATPAL